MAGDSWRTNVYVRIVSKAARPAAAQNLRPPASKMTAVPPLLVIVSVAEREPGACGTKLITTVQLCAAARPTPRRTSRCA
jgi:hypothetical protein